MLLITLSLTARQSASSFAYGSCCSSSNSSSSSSSPEGRGSLMHILYSDSCNYTYAFQWVKHQHLADLCKHLNLIFQMPNVRSMTGVRRIVMSLALCLWIKYRVSNQGFRPYALLPNNQLFLNYSDSNRWGTELLLDTCFIRGTSRTRTTRFKNRLLSLQIYCAFEA